MLICRSGRCSNLDETNWQWTHSSEFTILSKYLIQMNVLNPNETWRTKELIWNVLSLIDVYKIGPRLNVKKRSFSVEDVVELRRVFPLARIWTLLDSFEAVRRFVAHGRADGGVDGQGQEGAIGHPVSDAADVLVQEKTCFRGLVTVLRPARCR